jgi:hypothetical protein
MVAVAITQNFAIDQAMTEALDHFELEPLLRGKRVAVKPNDTWAYAEDTTAVTQPDTLRAVLRYVQQSRPRELVVTGGAGAAETEEVFRIGHRGLSHSMAFAVFLSACLTWLLPIEAQASRMMLFGFLFLSTISHGILDALTSGGLGVAFFAPFENSRYFFPWRPIRVSPMSVSACLSATGVRVLRSELQWIWLPAALVAVLLTLLRRSGSKPWRRHVLEVLRQATADAGQAEACFQQAVAMARHQQAKSWELRAGMSLRRLRQQQGKRAEAHKLLVPTDGWFTEGFDTADLQEAKALLEAFS